MLENVSALALVGCIVRLRFNDVKRPWAYAIASVKIALQIRAFVPSVLQPLMQALKKLIW